MTARNAEVLRTDTEFDVRGFLAPSEIPVDLMVGNTVAIVIDVVRTTTTLNAVFARKPAAVQIVTKTYDEVADLTPLRDGTPLVCGGEKMGLPFPGSIFSNSALDVPQGIAGKDVRFYSSNSGRVIDVLVGQVAPGDTAQILLASLFNLDAVTAVISTGNFDRVAVCAGGFYDRISLEDAVAGGRLIERLGIDATALDDGATTMVALAERFARDDDLIQAIANNRVGRTLRRFGRGVDIPAAVTGAGIPPRVVDTMRHTLGRLVWLDANTPVFVAHTNNEEYSWTESPWSATSSPPSTTAT